MSQEPPKFGETATPEAPKVVAETPTTPLPYGFPAENPPVATSKEDLKGPGTLATAIVVSKTGDLDVAPGTPVVTIAKHILDSPAVQKLLKVIYAAWTVFAGFVGYKIYVAGGIFGLDWNSVLHGAINTAVLSALAGYGIYAKVTDNDPIVNSNLSGRPEKPSNS